MRRGLFTLLLVAGPTSAIPLSAQTADAIVAQALAARGGLDRIRAIRAERITGTISFGPNDPGPLRVAMRRPGEAREEVALPDGTMLRWTDGKAGWIIQPAVDSTPKALVV